MNEKYDMNQDIELIHSFLNAPHIRKEYSEGKLYYCLLDIIVCTTQSVDPKDYFKKLKLKDRRLLQEWDSLIKLLPTQTNGGIQHLKFIDAPAFFRIIQIIPGDAAHNIKNAIARITNHCYNS